MHAKPIVATIPNYNGSDTILHNKTGLVYDPDDFDGMINGLSNLIENEEFRINLGNQAKKLLSARHDPRVVSKHVSNIYLTLLTK